MNSFAECRYGVTIPIRYTGMEEWLEDGVWRSGWRMEKWLEDGEVVGG